MHTITSPLDTFQKHFPWLEPKVNKENILYSFGCAKMATKAYRMALMIILRNELPLTALLETTWLNKYTFDISMTISFVPEEYTCADEAPDTERYQEEMAEWAIKEQ